MREFAVRVPDLDALFERARAAGINPGYRLGRDYPEYEDGLLVAITERRTQRGHRPAGRARRRGPRGGARLMAELDPRAGEQTLTIYERSVEGRRAFTPPPTDVPEVPLSRSCCPTGRAAPTPAELPEVSEPEIVRHYNGLSKKNFDLDTGFYPLGSCTMKHNPKLHERVAGAARATPACTRCRTPSTPRARSS